MHRNAYLVNTFVDETPNLQVSKEASKIVYIILK